MKKVDRQRQIQQIIEENDVERQDDLVRLLGEAGIQVTQATISRDIKEMKLIKVPSTHGGYHYSLPNYHQEDKEAQLTATIKSNLVELKRSDRMVGLVMQPGHGPLMALLVNSLKFPEVFMAIGVDANVLVVCQSQTAAAEFEERIDSLR